VNVFQYKTGMFTKNFEKFPLRDSKEFITITLKCFKPHEMFPIEGIDDTPIVALASFETIVFHKVEGGTMFF
jgi:hypothetical protein